MYLLPEFMKYSTLTDLETNVFVSRLNNFHFKIPIFKMGLSITIDVGESKMKIDLSKVFPYKKLVFFFIARNCV